MSSPLKTALPNASPESKRAPVPAARVFSIRLALLLLLGVVLVGGAVWLRSSRSMREAILRGKDLPELEAMVRSRPDDALAQYYLAKRYYLSRRFADASAAYEATVHLEPDSARAHLGLGLSLYETGRLKEAQVELEQTLRLEKRSAWAEYMLGKIAWLQGRLLDALPHMQRATKLDPRSDPAWYGLAICYIQLRRHDEAIEPLRNAIARRENSAQYHTALGEILVYRGHSEEGRKEYERALLLNPNYGPASGLMGRFYLEKVPGPAALDRAEEMLLRAIKNNTYHPEMVYLNAHRPAQ